MSSFLSLGRTAPYSSVVIVSPLVIDAVRTSAAAVGVTVPVTFYIVPALPSSFLIVILILRSCALPTAASVGVIDKRE